LPPELLLLAQICTKSFVGWGTGGAYSTLPDFLAGLGGGAPREREGQRGGGKGGSGGSHGMPKSRVAKPTLSAGQRSFHPIG